MSTSPYKEEIEKQLKAKYPYFTKSSSSTKTLVKMSEKLFESHLSDLIMKKKNMFLSNNASSKEASRFYQDSNKSRFSHLLSHTDQDNLKDLPVKPKLDVSDFNLNDDLSDQNSTKNSEDRKRSFKKLYSINQGNKTEDDNEEVIIERENEDQEKISSYTEITPKIESVVTIDFIDEEEKENVNIIYNNEKTSDGKREIQYISINLFLKKIALEKFSSSHPNLVQNFIHQYTSFLSPNILSQKIMNAFEYFWGKKGLQVIDLINFFNLIVAKFYYEIKIDSETFSKLKNIYHELQELDWIKNSGYIDNVTQMSTLFEGYDEKFDVEFVRHSLNKRKKSNNISIKSRPSSEKKSEFPYFNIFEYTEEEIANQLTSISFNLMCNIEEKEVISAKFAKKNKEKTSPNVLKVITRFDKLIYFIIEDIIAYDRKRTRAELIEKWIRIAMKCKELNNFNDTMIINASFCSYLLRRCTLTWKRVSKESMKDLQSLKEFCTCQKGYVKIREQINQCIEQNLPFVPYLGLLLKDIAFFEEKMEYIKDNTLINFNKITKVGDSIYKFNQFRNVSLRIRPDEKLNIFEHLNPRSEEELEKIINKIEPKLLMGKKVVNKKHRKTQTDETYYFESN